MKKGMTVLCGKKRFEISWLTRDVDGPTVLFIHGIGCTKDVFHRVWDVPQLEPFNLVTFDLLGFGDSSRPRDFSYALEDHAEICKRLIEEMNLHDIHLVGHSMGGAIGLLLIRKLTARIWSFVNLEGNLIGEDCFFSREVVKNSLATFERSGYENILSTMGASAKHKLVHDGLLKSDPLAFYRSSQSLVAWSDGGELLGLFRNLSIKKAYVFGDANKDIPVLPLLKGVPTMAIPNSGHFMMLDNPQECYRVLAGLIRGEF